MILPLIYIEILLHIPQSISSFFLLSSFSPVAILSRFSSVVNDVFKFMLCVNATMVEDTIVATIVYRYH